MTRAIRETTIFLFLFPIISAGSIDPWHALSVLKNQTFSEVAIFIPGTSHCANMGSESPDDPPALRQARQVRLVEGTGGRETGEKGAGGVWEAGLRRGGGKRDSQGGGKREKLKLRNVTEYFANEKMQRGGSQQIQGGNRD